MIDSHSNKRLSEVIDSIRFPLIYLVVIAHMVGFDTPRINFSTNPIDIYTLLSELFSHNLARISVRVYFFISGYYLFKKLYNTDELNVQSFIKGKFRTLLLPYFAWNAILIIAMLTKYYLLNLFNLNTENSTHEYNFLKNSSLYYLFWEGPINFPLWYMRDLMIMTILSPLFFLLFRYTKYVFLILLVPIYIYQNYSLFTGISVEGVLFFGSGAFLALNNKDILKLFSRYSSVFYVITVILLLIAVYYNGTKYHGYFQRSFLVFGVISVFNLFNYLNNYNTIKNLFKKLAPYTFFVYVVHEIYIINILKGVWIKVSDMTNIWIKILGYFIVPLLCIIVCIFLFEIVKKIFPRVLTLLTGGREKPYVPKKI